ncbi:hypothetical protein ABID26_004483 [Mesorhizobium shonense]|uniref:Uncharacterized protein n=1 Tax=Mesorhizobium shonense TaxID=1209948 RepID=A0ABV2HWV5_9HYPH
MNWRDAKQPDNELSYGTIWPATLRPSSSREVVDNFTGLY